jgi:hypothetical protein
MANKLAGQRAKFSRAKAIFYSTSDDAQRYRAAELMAQVLAEAPANGFTEDDVTQGEDVPDDARQLSSRLPVEPPAIEDPDALVVALQATVDTADVLEIGQGDEFVYAYGYRCAPDRLKIGSCSGDVIARIAAQIGTGTPDKPVLLLRIRTHDCRALERTLHGMLRLKGKQIAGAGAEWFLATRDELIAAHEKIVG